MSTNVCNFCVNHLYSTYRYVICVKCVQINFSGSRMYSKSKDENLGKKYKITHTNFTFYTQI